MKKDEVTIGGTYSARVGSRTLDVRIESENAKGGWNGVAVESGKPVRIKDTRHLRAAAAPKGDGRTVEPVDDVGVTRDGGAGPSSCSRTAS